MDHASAGWDFNDQRMIDVYMKILQRIGVESQGHGRAGKADLVAHGQDT